MKDELTGDQLVALVQRVFKPTSQDKRLAILVDVPNSSDEDNDLWKDRRQIAADWAKRLTEKKMSLGLETDLFVYTSTGRNNADLPGQADLVGAIDFLQNGADDREQNRVGFASLYASHSIIMAITEFSSTAPLKNAAKQYGFRGATMPGFCRSMIPALALDYTEISRRVMILKDCLDKAEAAEARFHIKGSNRLCTLNLDLRHRTAHASTGLMHEIGTVGNLPSGEAYIVPYEGEVQGIASNTQGELPVQFEDEVVIYTIRGNRAISVGGTGTRGNTEAEYLKKEPAYGNLAELGLGVLGEFGVEPANEVLLDEKLGLHIAFGRSDHFGGSTGPKDFSRPEEAVHIDRVYVSSTQPLVELKSLKLKNPDGEEILLMDGYQYHPRVMKK